MKAVLETLTSLAKKLGRQRKSKHAAPHVDIYGRAVENAEIYFYPEQIKGIPVFDVDTIISHYVEHINEIRKCVAIGEHRVTLEGQNLFHELIINPIRRYIEYVHMLPASENHHHAAPGGLIVHSLEASVLAMRYAMEHKPPSTGMVDLDRAQQPVFHYAAWIAGLLHDAGKILRDVTVSAVEVIDPKTNASLAAGEDIPQWQPQKESLIKWASRFGVASYSVGYIETRVHRRHNMDSVQFLEPVIEKGAALDYILSQKGVHSALTEVLAGYSTSKGYLSQAVRKGDTISTARDTSIRRDLLLGQRVVSPAVLIWKALSLAKENWKINERNAHLWVIGGDVYLRWSSAIDSIIKKAIEFDFNIPRDARTVVDMMEDRGMITWFDKENRSIKFSAGKYTAKEQREIINGQTAIIWEELLRVKWTGFVFGDDPLPDSESGLIYLPNTDEFVICDHEGNFELVASKSKSQDQEKSDTTNADKVTSAAKTIAVDETGAKPTEANSTKKSTVQTGKKTKQSEKRAAGSAASEPIDDKEQNSDVAASVDVKGEVSPPSAGKPNANQCSHSEGNDQNKRTEEQAQDKPDHKGIIFKNASIEDRKSNAIKPELKNLLDKKCRYIVESDALYLDADNAAEIEQKPIKEIGLAFKKAGIIKVNLTNPNQFTTSLSGKKYFRIESQHHAEFNYNCSQDDSPLANDSSEKEEQNLDFGLRMAIAKAANGTLADCISQLDDDQVSKVTTETKKGLQIHCLEFERVIRKRWKNANFRMTKLMASIEKQQVAAETDDHKQMLLIRYCDLNEIRMDLRNDTQN